MYLFLLTHNDNFKVTVSVCSLKMYQEQGRNVRQSLNVVTLFDNFHVKTISFNRFLLINEVHPYMDLLLLAHRLEV